MRAVSTVLTKTISVRVTEEEHQEYMERGGSKYFRKLLSGAEPSDIESVVRRILAEGAVPSPAPVVTAEKIPKVAVDQGADDDITNNIKSMFEM